MKNEQIQEIIDYLDGGDKFLDVLIEELKNPNLEDYERKTYTGLVESLLGATELYCAMSEDEEGDEDGSLQFNQVPIEYAHEMLEDGCLNNIMPVYESLNTNIQSGIHLRFKFETIGAGFKFRDLFIKKDGTVHISKEY